MGVTYPQAICYIVDNYLYYYHMYYTIINTICISCILIYRGIYIYLFFKRGYYGAKYYRGSLLDIDVCMQYGRYSGRD